MSAYMPHGYCLLWQPTLMGLHVISDALIGLAYFSIPLMLWYFVRRRTDVPFHGLVLMFAAFIYWCGLTHVMNIVVLWFPLYWIDGFIKAGTAVVSVATAIVLFPALPKLLALRSPRELEALNDELQEALDEKSALLIAYEREAHIAATLQRALLPQQLPRISGLRIDTTYVPATNETQIGGDWYDAFALGDDMVAFTIGDVSGHGLRAANTMGSVRQALRTASREDSNPSRVLERVNALVCSEGFDLVTAFYGVLNLRTGLMRYGNAGHVPPLLARAADHIETLASDGLILGVNRNARYASFDTYLAVGDAITLYTDGVVEIQRDLIEGTARLSEAIRNETKQPHGNIAEDVLARVVGRAQIRDDCAVMVIGVTEIGASPSLGDRKTWSFDATKMKEARRIQRALMWYLGETASVDSDFISTEIIFSELLGNVARHTQGKATASIEWINGSAILEMFDTGAAFSAPHALPDPYDESGRGLFLVQQLARELRIERAGEGNRVTVRLPVEPQ